MKLKTLKDIDIKNKTILYRAPYDIGTLEVNGVYEVNDDMRIRGTLPTLRYMIAEGAKIVILTYVKRPNGEVVESLRTNPHARKLAELLNHKVDKVDDCIGEEVEAKISNMNPGDVLMLENVRFHKEEMEDNDEFAKELCKSKDLVVFDGFPQAHRVHSSTTGIMRHLPSVAGLYLESEVTNLSALIENPIKPFAVVIGGAKISDKVDAINNLLKKADTILVGGAVANVFLKAKGFELGDSFIEDVFVDEARKEKKDWVSYAQEIMINAENLTKQIILPSDVVISNGNEIKNINIEDGVPPGWRALDIGPETQLVFAEVISKSKTVFLNGPMGKFENETFMIGTKKVLEKMKSIDGTTIVAGGDTIDLVRKEKQEENFSYLSLAGGATLEFLAGKELPALKALELNS